MGIQGNEEADLYTIKESIKHSLDHSLTEHESGFQTKTRNTSRTRTDRDMLNGWML